MEKGRVVGIGRNRIRKPERGSDGCGAKQIERVDFGENDSVSAQIERGGGLREFPWGPSKEEWAWACARAWAGGEKFLIGWSAEEGVVMVRCGPWECGCGGEEGSGFAFGLGVICE